MSKVKFHIILCTLLMVWNFSLAQQITNYDVNDGLPSNHVYRLTQDSNGFIWIATDKGLVRYNGDRFQNYTTREGLPINDIWGINHTPDGKIWYFSKSPKLGYIEQNKVYSFPSVNETEVLNPVVQNQSGNEITISGGAQTYGLSSDKQWKVIEKKDEDRQRMATIIHPEVLQISSDEARDSLFVIGNDKKVLKRLPKDHTAFFSSIRGQLNDSLVYWMNARGFVFINLNNLTVHKREFQTEIDRNELRFARFHLINNQIQLTGQNFLGILDEQLRVESLMDIPTELNFHFACMDREETIWLATFSNGIFKFPKHKKNIRYSLTNEKIGQLNEVGDDLVASVYDLGFYKYNTEAQAFQPFIEEDGYILAASEVPEIGTNFYLTGRKVISETTNGIQSLVNGEDGETVNALARRLVYLDGFLYGNFSGGVNKIDPVSLQVVRSYPMVGVYSLTTFRSELYVGSPNGLKVLRNDELEAVSFADELFDRPILSLNNVGDSELIITTDGYGAYVTDLSSIQLLPGSDYLSVQDSYSKDGSIWLATDEGVWKYVWNNGSYQKTAEINETDGLPTRNINAISMVGNSLVLGTDNGAAVLPSEIAAGSSIIDLYFEKATNGNIDLFEDSEFMYRNDNNVNITIESIDFSDSVEPTVYQYKLLPGQDEWIQTTSKSLNFSNLAPAAYQLQIKSGDIEKTLTFEILPLWWQKAWVRILGMIVLALIIIGLIIYGTRYFQKKQTRRLVQEKRLSELQLSALRSQMNPHFVFNSLAAIQYYINNNELEKSESYLVKFSKLIRRYFELSKEHQISVKEEVTLLNNYLEIEKLRFKDKLDFDINIDAAISADTEMIPSMLLQPIVENAVNHGIFNKEQEGKIEIRFESLNGRGIKVEIEDDGVGYVNTTRKSREKARSSNVISERLFFLNQSERWNINMSRREAHPGATNPGNICIFEIKNRS